MEPPQRALFLSAEVLSVTVRKSQSLAASSPPSANEPVR